MYTFNFNKTSREVTDDFAEKVAEQLLTKGKDDYFVIGKQFIGQIKKFESLEAIDNDIASDEEWEINRPPMPTSEKDGKSTHNGVAIPDDLKLDI
jgi:hypothetical protein